jgi:hypothetical protein
MAELKISNYETFVNIKFDTLGNEEDSLEIKMINEDGKKFIYIDIFKEDAKQIISFLQTHFNL